MTNQKCFKKKQVSTNLALWGLRGEKNMLSLVNINICVNVTAFVMYTQTEKKTWQPDQIVVSIFVFTKAFFVLTWSVMDIFFFYGEKLQVQRNDGRIGYMNTIRIKEIPLTIVSALSGPYMCNVYVPGAAPHTLFIAHESWTMATQK